MDIFQRGDRDPADRRPDWVIFQEREERLREDVHEAWAQYEQERSDERYDQRASVTEADTDDDVDC